MKANRTFLRFAGICGILAGIFTMLLWSIPLVYGRPSGMEESLALHNNPLYMIRQWISYVNVFFVLIAGLGLTIYKSKTALGSASTGMLFLFIYGVAELMGRSAIIFVRENRWTAQYLSETDPAIKSQLVDLITTFNQVWSGCYSLLLISFALSAIAFAFATRKGQGLERWVCLLLFVSGILALLTFTTQQTGSTTLRTIAFWGYPVIQPLSRVLIGVLLLRAIDFDFR